jgi:hypothetical protein
VQAALADPIEYVRELPEFTVRIHLGTQREILDKCNELHAWPERVEKVPKGKALGCSLFDTQTRVQDIYNPRPKDVDDAATTNLGHELLHAYAGRYH